MVEKNRVTVRIAGNEYVICGEESQEYIQKVALFVDRKLKEITRRNHLLSTSMASVLASVNMADEVFRLNEKLNNSKNELDQLQGKHQELQDEFERLKSENQQLKVKVTQLQIELTRREAELKEVRNTIDTISKKPDK